jgi:hypothetical protein
MNITEVTTAFKIADVEYIPNSTKLRFKYLPNLKNEHGEILPQSVLSKNLARVYIIVVDGEIKKIGGSQAEGGIKSTLQVYQDGGVRGRPSIRSFGVWYFLYHTILQGKKIEIYMIYQENFEMNIKGLFGLKKIYEAYISYKLIENCCIEDYLAHENNQYPEWNVQEQGADWPAEIKEGHSSITKNSLDKSSKRKQIELK